MCSPQAEEVGKDRSSNVTSIKVGIGGWIYAPWRGEFYPRGLPQAQELSYASRHLTSIEINGTFYGSQKPDSFRRWYSETPDDFVFSLKGPRYATHRRDFTEVSTTIDRFFASGVLELREKLGPILWQFPATARFDPGQFEHFLKSLPQTRDGFGLRHVVEVRHESFATGDFTQLLSQYGVVPALVDGDSYLTFAEVVGDLVYARLRRADLEEPTGYSESDLKIWTQRLRQWAGGKQGSEAETPGRRVSHYTRPSDCFVYFINGAKVRAPLAGMALIEHLSR
jgi:uncharacterized protein YecE (DUF72 family)